MQQRTLSFGYWLRRRRKALDLTQEALAQHVACSVFSIRKLESDERRPSRRLAERLASALAVAPAELRDFLDAARAVHAADRLALHDTPAAALALPAAPAATEATPFVGRGDELALLLQRVESLRDGNGHTVLIEGEPGIGKSRLLRELVQQARARGLPVLATKCYEIERAMPYQAVIDLVSRTLEHMPQAALAQMAPVSLAELRALVPELGDRVAELPTLSNDFPEARQARLSRAMGQLLDAAAGGRPSLLVVDDLQWADDASAQVLHYLARHAAQRAMLVLYAFRDEDAASDERLARLLDSLRHDAAAQRLPLPRLSAEHTAQLVAALAGAQSDEPGLAERLHRETEGHPFFLTSILQSIGDGAWPAGLPPAGTEAWLPEALRAAVRARVAQVPKAMRPVLETAAVLGRHFDFDTLLEVTRASEPALLEAVDALVRRRLLREDSDGGSFDFSHDKLREGVYLDIGSARRMRLHQAVAEALERRGPERTPEYDARLAEHFERAQVWPKALHHLVLAGERALALFAMRDALHWLDRALALAEAHPQALDAQRRLALWALRGTARAQAGQTQGAVDDIRRVVDAARAAGARERTRDALVQLGMAYRRADAYEQASACLAEALQECRAMHDEHGAADTLYHLGTVAWSTGRNGEAIGFHAQAVEICERRQLDGLVAVQAWHGRGEAHFADAQPQAAIDCYGRSLALARGLGDKGYESENLMMIGHACTGTKGLGDYARAERQLQAALDIARAADLQWHLGPTLLGLDHVRACTGRYGLAWTGMQETLRWLQGLKQARYQFIAYDFIGQLLLDLGLDALALQHMERGLALARDSGIGFWRAAIEAHAAVARTRLGERDAAAALQSTLQRTRADAERYLALRCLDALAEVSLRNGDAAACAECADGLLAIALPDGLREAEANARRWRGEALLARHELAAAIDELTQAAALADAIGRVRLQLDLQIALARGRDAHGQHAAASRHRERAQQIARAIEASLRDTALQASVRLAV